MRLREFLTLQEVEETGGDLERKIESLAYDSRKVSAGAVFFAIPGEKLDGHRFIDEALARGAAAVVLERGAPQGATFVRVANVRRCMALWSAAFFGRPSDAMRVIGITGTNGKTTVSYLVESIFSAAGLEPGVIGTVSYRYRGREIASRHTTPESLDLQSLLAQMARNGVQSMAIEVSSHALVQERVRGLNFDAAVFTNLSRDHLDYHADMDEYFAAKSSLFTDYLHNSTKDGRAAVVYGEDPRGPELIRKTGGRGIDVWSYGEAAHWDIHPVDVKSDVAGLSGKLMLRGKPVDFHSSLIGAANLQNIMAAAGVGMALGLSSDTIAAGIERLASVPGRLEKVDNRLGVSILVDYAHTPDALEKVLLAVRPLARGRVIAVFGCGGDRDRGKRPLMGAIAARLGDLVLVTSDNPRTEDPLQILSEVEAGVRKQGMAAIERPERLQALAGRAESEATVRGYAVVPDRREAIRLALSAARPGDLVLIAGKGHEDYQILAERRIHFDDREVAREEANRIAG